MAGPGRTGVASAEDGFAIVPADGADLELETRQIVVGGAGALVAVMKSGRTVTFTCIAGQTLNIKVTRVLATGTTATGLVGLV